MSICSLVSDFEQHVHLGREACIAEKSLVQYISCFCAFTHVKPLCDSLSSEIATIHGFMQVCKLSRQLQVGTQADCRWVPQPVCQGRDEDTAMLVS